MTRLPALAVLLTLGLALAPAALAADPVTEATQALRTDPVYQAPRAELALRPAQLDELRTHIRDSGAPVYVAILPAAAGDPVRVLSSVAPGSGRAGVFAVVVGRTLRAASNTEAKGTAGAEATAAFQAHHGQGLLRVLEDFVDRSARPGVQGPPRRGGGGAPWLLIVLLCGAGGLLAARTLGRGRRRRQAQEADFAGMRRTAEGDVSAIADEITDLDDDVERAGAPPEAKAAYLRALDAYEQADAGLRRARSAEELHAVAERAADGRFEMATARALLEGRPPPERRAPCFFDPRHGPSVADAEYAPPGGEPRPVPVCRACAVRLQEGEEPETRVESVGGRATPYWAAPGGYYGGYFGGFGGAGFLGGLLLGSMLDPMGSAWAGSGVDMGDGGGFDFGSSGGGDFGGGDFGGGDFGGGGDF
jgi:hypothetical protein